MLVPSCALLFRHLPTPVPFCKSLELHDRKGTEGQRTVSRCRNHKTVYDAARSSIGRSEYSTTFPGWCDKLLAAPTTMTDASVSWGGRPVKRAHTLNARAGRPCLLSSSPQCLTRCSVSASFGDALRKLFLLRIIVPAAATGHYPARRRRRP